MSARNYSVPSERVVPRAKAAVCLVSPRSHERVLNHLFAFVKTIIAHESSKFPHTIVSARRYAAA